MPPDVREALQDAAVRPLRQPDLEGVVRRGYRERRQRVLLVALCALAAVVVPIGVVASGPLLESPFDRSAPGPAASVGDRWGSRCPKAGPEITAFFDDRVTRAAMQAAARAVAGMPEVSEVRNVDRRRAYEELKKSYGREIARKRAELEEILARSKRQLGKGSPDRVELPEHAFPGWLTVSITEEADLQLVARRIELMKRIAKVQIVDRQQQRIRCRLSGGGAGSP